MMVESEQPPDPRQVLAGLEDGRTSVVETFKDDARSTVQRVEHAGRPYVIKRYHAPPPLTWLYHRLRVTPAWREVNAIRKLHEHGFRTNPPLLLHHDHGLFSSKQALVFTYIDGLSLHHFVRNQADPTVRDRVLIAVGEQAGRLTAIGAINRDHKPSNLIIDADCADADQPPVIIDPLGLRRRSEAGVAQMFAVLRKPIAEQISEQEWRLVTEAARAADPTLPASL